CWVHPCLSKMTDWMPLNVLPNDAVSVHGAATRIPSFTRLFGFRVRRTPFSVVQAPSTLPVRTTLRPPSHGLQRARNFHPCLVRFGRVTIAPPSVLTVTPVASIDTRRRTDAGTPDTPDWATANCAAQAGAFAATAGDDGPAARNVAIDAIRNARVRMVP